MTAALALARAALGALLTRWRPALALLVAGILAAGFYLQHTRLTAARADAARAADALTVARAEQRALTAQLDAQSAAVAALEAESKRLAAAGKTAARESARALAEADARARALASAPVPADCPGAMQWLAEQAPDLGRGFE